MSDIDTVRAYLSDTDSAAYELSDAQITTFLGLYPSPLRAAAYAALSIAAKYARKSSRSIDGLTINYGGVSSLYESLYKTLLAESDRNSDAGIYAGGISEMERAVDASNTDLKPSSFSIGQFANRLL